MDHVVKRLWSEDSVDFAGKFFTMKDCQSKPKPLSKPRPEIVCAGMSDRGFQFSVREADVCFIGGRTPDERRDASLRAKKAAEGMGKTIKTYAMCTVVHGDTDAKAAGHGRALQGRRRHGRDPGHAGQLGRAGREAGQRRGPAGRVHDPHRGRLAPATCREQIEEFVSYCELDGLMLIFPDYVEGLTMFGSEILPGLRAVYS
jgi:pyrimidine oxygenase